MAIGDVAGRALGFVRYMILTRLLAPDKIGSMAVVLSAALFFETFLEVGVKHSVIQNKKGADPDYLNVAWWCQAIRGLGLYILGFLAAPAVSWFYGRPELSAFLQVALFALLFRTLISPRAHVLEKQFRFGWAVILLQGSKVFGTVLTVALGGNILDVRVSGYSSSWWHDPDRIWGTNIRTGKTRHFSPSDVCALRKKGGGG